MFQNSVISILAGLLLILGAGTVVYKNKTPYLDTTTNNAQSVEQSGSKQSVNEGASTRDDSDDEDDEDEVKNSTTPTKSTTPNTSTNTSTSQTSGGITMSDVAKHGSRSSCWSAINGSVYDLTSWIPNHPGGEQTILSLCGVDGSNAYNGQHGGSTKTARILGGFKIGVLVK